MSLRIRIITDKFMTTSIVLCSILLLVNVGLTFGGFLYQIKKRYGVNWLAREQPELKELN